MHLHAMYLETDHLSLSKMSKSKLTILGLWSCRALPGCLQLHRHLPSRAFLITDSSIFAVFKAQVSVTPKPFITFLAVPKIFRVDVNLGYLYLNCHLLSTTWQILLSWEIGSLHLRTPMCRNILRTFQKHQGQNFSTASVAY